MSDLHEHREYGVTQQEVTGKTDVTYDPGNLHSVLGLGRTLYCEYYVILSCPPILHLRRGLPCLFEL
jgi:hypothetical protein